MRMEEGGINAFGERQLLFLNVQLFSAAPKEHHQVASDLERAGRCGEFENPFQLFPLLSVPKSHQLLGREVNLAVSSVLGGESGGGSIIFITFGREASGFQRGSFDCFPPFRHLPLPLSPSLSLPLSATRG